MRGAPYARAVRRPPVAAMPAIVLASASATTMATGASPRRSANVRLVRSGSSANRVSAVNRAVHCWTTPSGPMTADTPTVETCTVARPCSTARSRDIASCWVDSAVRPKEALFVGTTSSSAPLRTASRTTSSNATSKQITVANGTDRPSLGASRGTTAGCVPASMSTSTRSTWVEKSRSRPRSGTYSPNGAGRCLAYANVAPRPGCHSTISSYRPPSA